MNRIKILILIVTLLHSFSSHAGVEKLIKNVMPAGTMSNATRGAIIQEQTAGHLIGGSLIIKTPAQGELQPIHVQAPSCKLGGLPCGAQFEILGGSLSLIKGEELMRHLKGMVQNAGTYAGLMAIQTLCPQCEDIMTWLDGKADWLNNLLKTDCEDMARLADGMLAKTMAGARAKRQSNSVLRGDGRDMADFARNSKADIDNPTGGNPELESVLGDNYNLVWKALDKRVTSGGDGKSLKELLMSISGTIIGKKDNTGKRAVIHKRSLVDKELIEEFIGAKSGGGRLAVNLYACDEEAQCLNPNITAVNINSNDTLMGRIGTLLASITDKISKDTENFTAEEETLIVLSSIQLITKIELDLKAYSNPAQVSVMQTEFVEALCYDVVTGYLARLLKETQTAVDELSFVQIADSSVFQKFDTETREVMRLLSRAKHEAFGKYDLIAQTKARIRQEINYFDMKFEEFCSNQNPS
jgi:hypothetical protein